MTFITFGLGMLTVSDRYSLVGVEIWGYGAA